MENTFIHVSMYYIVLDHKVFQNTTKSLILAVKSLYIGVGYRDQKLIFLGESIFCIHLYANITKKVISSKFCKNWRRCRPKITEGVSNLEKHENNQLFHAYQ